MAGGRLLGALLGAATSYAKIAWWGLVSPRVERDPLVLVQAVIVGEQGVLLAERSDLRGWELPGGRREAGEGDEAALRRELREEIDLEVDIERFLGAWKRRGFRPHTAHVYCCRARGEARPAGDETLAVAWFPPDSPPETLFPWYREALGLGVGAAVDPVEREETQGLTVILEAARIDLTTRMQRRSSGVRQSPK